MRGHEVSYRYFVLALVTGGKEVRRQDVLDEARADPGRFLTVDASCVGCGGSARVSQFMGAHGGGKFDRLHLESLELSAADALSLDGMTCDECVAAYVLWA